MPNSFNSPLAQGILFLWWHTTIYLPSKRAEGRILNWPKVKAFLYLNRHPGYVEPSTQGWYLTLKCPSQPSAEWGVHLEKKPSCSSASMTRLQQNRKGTWHDRLDVMASSWVFLCSMIYWLILQDVCFIQLEYWGWHLFGANLRNTHLNAHLRNTAGHSPRAS